MKTLIIDAIIGKGFLSVSDGVEMQRRGLAHFSGNQWNEKWDWNRSELERLEINDLEQIYARISASTDMKSTTTLVSDENLTDITDDGIINNIKKSLNATLHKTFAKQYKYPHNPSSVEKDL